MIVIEVTADLYRANEQAISEWVTDHGLAENRIPVPCLIAIADGQVTVEEYVRGKRGVIVAPHGDPYRVPVTVPLVRPWPLTPNLTRDDRRP